MTPEKIKRLCPEFAGWHKWHGEPPTDNYDKKITTLIESLAEARKALEVLNTARPLEEWHEDFGEKLWWKFPIKESPYTGSPLDCGWPAYHTHFTDIPVPLPPVEGR